MSSNRLTKLMAFDLQLQSMHMLPTKYVIGIDEVGRGSLIGSVVAAAFCWPLEFSLKALSKEHHELLQALNDSKQVRLDIRTQLSPVLQEIGFHAVGEANVEEIKEHNIHHASLLACYRAFEVVFTSLKVQEPGLQRQDCLILIDGRTYLPQVSRVHQIPVVKGDAQSSVIAAASVIAKHTRDSAIIALAKEYPGYGWEKNMGYPTPAHRAGMEELGITPLHRQGYKLVQAQLTLF